MQRRWRGTDMSLVHAMEPFGVWHYWWLDWTQIYYIVVRLT